MQLAPEHGVTSSKTPVTYRSPRSAPVPAHGARKDRRSARVDMRAKRVEDLPGRHDVFAALRP